MDFSHSWNDTPEVSEKKGDAEPEFSQASLDRFDQLWDEDTPDVSDAIHEDIPERSADDITGYDALFDGEETMPEDGADNPDDTEKKELTEEEKQQRIQDFLDGKVGFDEVKEIFAEYYANAVNTNRPWSWEEHVPGGDQLTGSQRKAICECAREKGMVPTVPTRDVDGKRYADFSQFSVFDCVLDKKDWDKTDSEQFARCNEMLKKAIAENPELAKSFTQEQLAQIERGETPEGYTWHHSEKDGTMQLVPYGVHNSTWHHGGRSEGNWANGSRY